MHTSTTPLLLLSLLTSLISAEELKSSDVPAACSTICGPIVTLTNTCDINPDDDNNNNTSGGKGRRGLHLRRRPEDDNGGGGKESPDDESDEPIEAQCICTNKSFNVQRVAALCAACLTQNGGETEGELLLRPLFLLLPRPQSLSSRTNKTPYPPWLYNHYQPLKPHTC